MRHLPLILICLLGFSLRLHKLDAVPLRGDEAFSVQYWADTPLAVSLGEIAQGEPHTPLVYVVARAWRLIIGGVDSVFALRYLAALGNIIGVMGIWALGWRLTGERRIGLVAALLWALHPYEIWHSQEFRNYAWWAGLSVTSLWLGARLVERDTRANWLAYGLVGGFCALAIYTEPFTTLALAGYALLHRRGDRRFLMRLLALQALFAALLVGGFALLQVRSGYAQTYPGLQPAFSLPDYVTVFAPTLTLGSSIPLDQAALGVAISLWLAVAAAIAHRCRRSAFQLLALAAVLPLLGLGLASQFWDLFHPRYVLSVAPALLLLLVVGSFCLAERLRRWIRLGLPALALLLLSPWFVLAALTLDAHYNNPLFRKSPAWDALGAFLNERVSERDLVIQLASDAAFGYYYRGAAPDIGLPVNGGQSIADIQARLRDLVDDYASVYVAAREQAGWGNAGAVDAWLGEHRQEVLRTQAAGMPVRQYRSRQVESGGAPLANFAGIVSLLGYTFHPEPLPSGEWLLWLDWQPLSRSARALKTFAHVAALDAGGLGELATQADQVPRQAGGLDSSDWDLQMPFRDVLYLPAAGIAAGQYEIRIGWYEEATGERLRTEQGADVYALLRFRHGG
ncbi:MAG: glycosyltransferase family 39 protein [Chloroflexi bacterium]|nr:glycosyltransferase family 39 protein [Chloroflexota bacterium]MCY4247914.1 glycosyltransferase family 39 protein [Chloroflexota bacterium]